MKSIHLKIFCVTVLLYSVVATPQNEGQQQQNCSNKGERRTRHKKYHEAGRRDTHNQNVQGSHERTSNGHDSPNGSQNHYPNIATSTSRKPEFVEPILSPLMRSTARSAEMFSMELFYEIANSNKYAEENFVISPFSIWSLLLMVADGASEHSLEQLKQTIHLQDANQFGSLYKDLEHILFPNASKIGFSVIQALFYNSTLKISKQYLDSLATKYQAHHEAVDFGNGLNARDNINNYINEQTKGKIQKIVDVEDLVGTQILLSSSTFFNGEWKYPFDVNDTRKMPFMNDRGEKIADVDMMTMQNPLRNAVFDYLSASIVELPYGGDDRLGLLLIYPFRNATLSSVFQNLLRVDVQKINGEIYKHENVDHVIVTLPKFEIESKMDVRSALRHLGIADIFSQNNAKFAKMTENSVRISHVHQKAIIEVNEVGTVASATPHANAADFSRDPIEYIFYKPFGFMITDRLTHTLLFAGQVKNPGEKRNREEMSNAGRTTNPTGRTNPAGKQPVLSSQPGMQ